MPYDYYDANGYLSYGPTVTGWARLRGLLTGLGAAIDELFRVGATERLGELRDQLSRASAGNDADMAASLRHLREVARDADTVLIVTDGVGIGE